MTNDFLNSLSESAKISTEEFSSLLNSDSSFVQEAIQKLVNDKVNKALESAIMQDLENTELITAMIEVTVKPEGGAGFDKIGEKISKFPEVKSVFLMSGGNDLTIIIEAKTLKEISQFVSEKLSVLALVNSTHTKLVLKKYKENGEVFKTSKSDDERLIISP